MRIDHILIGSLAASELVDLHRGTNDVDYICTYEFFEAEVKAAREAGVLKSVYPLSGTKQLMIKQYASDTKPQHVEFEIAWEGSNQAELLDIVNEHPHLLKGVGTIKAGLDLCYTLKMSHRYLRNSPHFLKTMRDIHYMRRAGAKIPEVLQKWFVRREAETYDYGHPSLAQSKKGFFDDSVDYKYDHDWLHRVVVDIDGEGDTQPTYTLYLMDGEEVMCDFNKWEALDDSHKISAVAEEAMVLALERCLVPFEGAKTPDQAFEMALMKVCTSITSGWFREFAWENYGAVIEFYQFSKILGGCYYDRLKREIALGNAVMFKR